MNFGSPFQLLVQHPGSHSDLLHLQGYIYEQTSLLHFFVYPWRQHRRTYYLPLIATS